MRLLARRDPLITVEEEEEAPNITAVEAIITQLTQAGAQVTCILHLHRTRIPHR
jgi:hypothetical protein